MSGRFARDSWLLSGLAVVLTFLVLNFNFISLRSLFKWDAWDLFWPMFACLAESLQDGRIPLWDPRPCCGVPFHSDPLTGTFYPVSVLVGLMFGGGYAVYQWFWLIHWLMAAMGAFFLVKNMGMSPVASWSASVIFAFSGFFIGGAQHTVCVVSVCYVVWALALLETAYERHFLYSVPAGVLFGLGALGGYPGMTIYSGIMLVLWCALKHGITRKTVAILCAAFVTGFLVLSPSYVSFAVECSGYTDRVGRLGIREASNVNRFPFDAIISLVAPAITGTYPNLFNATPGEAPLLNGYFGILGLVSLISTACVATLRERWKWLLWFMLAVFLFVLGSAGGLRVIGYYVFPPLGFVRHTSMAKVFWMLGGAVLAADIIDRLAQEQPGERSPIGSWLIKALGLVFYAGFCAFTSAWLGPDHWIRFGFPDTVSAVPNSWQTALSCVGPQLILVVLFAVAVYLYRTSVPRAVATGMIVCLVFLDAGVHFYTNRDIAGWNGEARSTAAGLEQVSRSSVNRQLKPDEKTISPPQYNLNIWAFDHGAYVRSYLGPRSSNYDFLVGNAWPPYHETKFVHVLSRSSGFWLTPAVALCKEDDKHAISLLRDTEVGGIMPVSIHDPSAAVPGGQVQPVRPKTYGDVKIVRYKPELVELLVDAPQDCWLFCTERYAPAWKAFCDNKPVGLYKANFCFRACPVPAGNHRIRMEYNPWIYKPLLIVSWTLIFLVFAGWACSGWVCSRFAK